MKRFALTTLLVWCSVLITLAQTSTSASQATGAEGKKKAMMQGGMSGMMDHCKMHCQDTMTVMNTLAKQVEEARQSNDVTKMRVALDAVAKHHNDMRQHMQTCMRNMQGGDANTGSQGSVHQHEPGAAPKK
jgi:hypothetical protein